VALLSGVVYSGGVANAGGETRLRAFLSTPEVDPFALNVAEVEAATMGLWL